MARILVVDDEDSIRKSVGQMLKSHEVTQASDGAEALRKLEKDHFDLVISDCNMPTMDGPDLLDRLRKDWLTASIPFILMSGECDEKARAASARHGITLLQKPFRLKEFRETVAAHLTPKTS
jgi:CheY-like chemotaxis protein